MSPANYRHRNILSRFLLPATLCLMLLVGTVGISYANSTEESNYGDGGYGLCDYGSCLLTLTSSDTVDLSVMPNAAGLCTVQPDAVGVTTSNSSGYVLTFTTSTTSTNMVSGANTMATSSGTQSSPISLANNTWGYRVDSSTIGTFGTGPTSSQTSSSRPSVLFAGAPASNGTAATLASSNIAASPTVTTNVWYGVCASTSQPSGVYSVSVLYTAVAND